MNAFEGHDGEGRRTRRSVHNAAIVFVGCDWDFATLLVAIIPHECRFVSFFIRAQTASH